MNEESVALDDKKRKKREYRFGEKMFISFIITFSAGVFCYENYMPESFMNVYKYMVLGVCLLTWLVFSFFSGVNKKWQYSLFTVLFWLLPQLIIFLADNGPRAFRLSVTMYLLSEFSNILISAPVKLLGGLMNIKIIPCVMIIVLSCIFSFLSGVLLSDRLDKKTHRQ